MDCKQGVENSGKVFTQFDWQNLFVPKTSTLNPQLMHNRGEARSFSYRKSDIELNSPDGKREFNGIISFLKRIFEMELQESQKITTFQNTVSLIRFIIFLS